MALQMVKDSNGRDSELKMRLKVDNYMNAAVRECYATFKNVINSLVLGEREKVWVCYIWYTYSKEQESTITSVVMYYVISLMVFSVQDYKWNFLQGWWSYTKGWFDKGIEYDCSPWPVWTIY